MRGMGGGGVAGVGGRELWSGGGGGGASGLGAESVDVCDGGGGVVWGMRGGCAGWVVVCGWFGSGVGYWGVVEGRVGGMEKGFGDRGITSGSYGGQEWGSYGVFRGGVGVRSVRCAGCRG